MKDLEKYKKSLKKDIEEIREDIALLTKSINEFDTAVSEAETFEELYDVIENADLDARLKHIELF